MLRSMNSPMDAQEDHLRRLLDLRAARADLHGRIPSISEFTDTPSIYSNAFFSPRPLDKPDVEADNSLYEPSCRASIASRSPEPISPSSNHEFLGNRAASILELDEDSPSSFPPAVHPYCDEENSRIDEEEEVDGDEDPDTHMSLLGPKMRFHSRAPWETGEDALREEDEPEEGVPSNRGRGMFSKGEGIIKGFGLASSGRRSSSAGRRSGESARSQGMSKSSYETTLPQPSSPRGALHVIAQTPSSSIPSSRASSALRNTNNSSLMRGRVHTPNNTSPIPSPHLSPTSSYSVSRSFSPNPPSTPSSPVPALAEPFRGLSRVDTTSSANPQPSSSFTHKDEFHPYANPDFAVPYTHEMSPLRHAFTLSSSNSSATVTESTTSGSLPRPVGPTPERPTLSALHLPRERTPSRASALNGKEISSPMSLVRPSLQGGERDSPGPSNNKDGLLALPSGIAGWNDRLVSPTFTLISLEEARAQRSRSATLHSVTPPKELGGPVNPLFPIRPDHDARADFGIGPSHDLQSVAVSRPRARSTSAGAKAKSPIHTVVGGPAAIKVERRDSDRSQDGGYSYSPSHSIASGRPHVRHKKSGFMRLFNGREKERERDGAFPPPIPALSDAYSTFNTSATHLYAPATTIQPAKPSPQRRPVPQLPSSLVGSSSDLRSNFSGEHEGRLDVNLTISRSSSKTPPVSKRTPPQLSINTLPPTRHKASDVSQSGRTSPVSRLTVSSGSDRSLPQSAPADAPLLSLRPVSTMFSAHFAEHIVSPAASLGSLSDSTLSTSPADTFTPITPVSSMRSMTSRGAVSLSPEDNPTVVQALQDQIVTAKKAWQRQVWELECQVRELKAELEDLRATDDQAHCEKCGRGKPTGTTATQAEEPSTAKKSGVVNRPRARTGAGAARFGSGG